MKKRLWWPLLILCSLFVLTGCGKSLSQQSTLANVQKSKTITWGVKGDVRLFGLIDVQDGQQKGFDIDLAKLLTKQILGPEGKAEFLTVTSQSRIPLLKNGNIDAIIATLNITPERKKIVNFSQMYFKAGQSLLVPKNSSIRRAQDLNGHTVIGVVGANSVENVKKVAPKARVLELQDYAQAMNALKSGQGEALTTDNGILYGLAVQNPGFEVRGGTFTYEPYGIAVNHGQVDLQKDIDRALKEVEANGEYNKLIRKWFSDVPGFNYKELYQ
ncbi:transporter substrate-binding domain-containing protein [Lactobacillus sp. DCY120]|uniref:Transporter substrate-binding domain-containing protein n=1 Tax=Bombilactobacillus apium TaxID=2675299 RepID=A0A850R5B2_9LACO|nr:transporter substrate-binding domain-containing protein [Bombilactobacillus apium]NVY97151.1 transporter substrate-binding domain-containing protein [Bombilactobacillus apium]